MVSGVAAVMSRLGLRLDTREFLHVSEQLLSAGHRVRFRAHGTSMFPAIEDGEVIMFERVEPSAVKAGDILLYHYKRRALAHRVVDIRCENGTVATFVLRGDTKKECDHPVRPDQVLGRVVLSEKPLRRRLFSYLRSLATLVRSHRLAPRAIRHA